MKKFTKGAIAFIITMVVGTLLMYFLQPELDKTSWGFVPISQIVLAPFMYYLLTLDPRRVERFRPLVILLFTFGAIVAMTFIMDLFKWDKVSGKLIAHTVGALLTLIFLCVQGSIAQKKES